MQRDSFTTLSLKDFKSAIVGAKCVIFYPQTRYRNVLMSYVLQLEEYALVYHRLTAETNTLTSMVEQIATTIASQFDQNDPSISAKNKPASLASAINKMLADCNQPVVLYIDELDRLPTDDAYRDFFSELVNNLPDQARLVINARILTTEPWRAMVHDGTVAVMGNERRATQLMFTEDKQERPQLEIYAFGRGHAIINGLPVENWDGALPRNLFFYFIDRDLVTRNDIFETFWAELAVKEATNVFHVTKRKISERLSLNVLGDGNYDLTNYSTGFYRPANQIVRHYDVHEFEEAVEKASMTFDDDKQLALYQRAVDLYHAPFLLTLDMPWVHDRREKLQRLFLEALIGVARIHKSAKRYDDALGYFIRALYEIPLREDLHREVMLLYQELGYPQDAINQYQHLEILLQDALGVQPGPETKSLLQKIQR